MEPATGSRRPRVVKRLLVMASVLALFACGTPAGEVGSSAGTSTTLQTAVPTSFPSCEDVPFIRAADDHYSVTPLYIANEMPIDEVRSWAEFQPGFEELWIDRERNGWLTLGFTEGVADAQAAVSREFPGVGVVVVEVPFTLQELMDLHGGIREVPPRGDGELRVEHLGPQGCRGDERRHPHRRDPPGDGRAFRR